MKKLFLSLTPLLFLSQLCLAFSSTTNPPANDDCQNPEVVFDNPIPGTTSCATSGFDQTCAFTDHQVWYEYTITNSEDVDLIVEVFPDGSNGNPASSLSVQVVYNCVHDLILFDEPCGSSGIVANSVEGGVTVKIVIGSEAGGEGDFQLFITESACQPPGNDICGESFDLNNGITQLGTLLCASGGDGCFGGSNEVYYEYTVQGPGASDVEFVLGFISADVVMDFFVDCGSTPYVPSQGCTEFEILENIPAGTTIFIYVSGGAGEFEITATELTNGNLMPNDECNNASILNVGVSCERELFCDSGDASPEVSNFGTSCDFMTLTTVWYTFTTGPSTTAVLIEDIFADMAVFENTCPPNSIVQDCFNDVVEISVLPNTTYLLATGQNTPGFIDNCFSLTYLEAPENSACIDAIDVGPGSHQGTTECASENFAICGSNDHVVYYTYTNNNASAVDVSLDIISDSMAELSVFSDCNDSPYDSSLPCAALQYYLACVPSGTTIIISVGAAENDANTFTLHIEEITSSTGNDSCDSAEPINIVENCSSQNIAGSAQSACPATSFTDCNAAEWPIRWYSFTTLANTSEIQISNLTSGFTYEVFEGGCPPSFSLSGCQDQDFNIQLSPNTDYLIAVSDPVANEFFSFDITFLSGLVEICDGIDNNCDGQIDEGITDTYYLDADGDGYGNIEESFVTCNPTVDYVLDSTDCNDSDPNINPGALEIPNNNIDENCDGELAITDIDMDGFDSSVDCDDNNPAINPGATEIPNNDTDENCDGVLGTSAIDADMDGFDSTADCDDSNPAINPSAIEIPDNDIDENCDGVLGTSTIDSDMDGFDSTVDCDDSNPAINPSAIEIPNNEIDENCDGVLGTSVIDSDMDGFDSTVDCDDSNPAINPSAIEICDGLDNDCDGMIDEGVVTNFYPDNDGDGYGTLEGGISACSIPLGFSDNSLDCNDADANINPDAMEIPNNGIDENCDGQLGMVDSDMDGFTNSVDCDDNDPAINPNAVEIPDNDIDENCDGVLGITDNDGDGFGINNDCDDNNANVNPNASEICDSVDNNCDGNVDEGLMSNYYPDNDGDGFGTIEGGISSCDPPAGYVLDNTDCDDGNPEIYPGAPQGPISGVDYNCDGVTLIVDNDQDGFDDTQDCDDENPDINPGATEIPNNDIDENCDGDVLVIDNDNDGFNSDQDCDDENPEINPEGTEIANNGIDEDCDGMDLIVDSVVNLGDIEVNIYPNPVADFMFVESTSALDLQYEFYDINGSLILLSANVGRKAEIDLSDVKQGIYVLVIKNVENKTKVAYRFVKM